MSKSTKVFVPKGLVFEVCPWAYNKCQLPAGEICKVKKAVIFAASLHNWKKAVGKALKCRHLGEELTRKQHEHRSMGVVV